MKVTRKWMLVSCLKNKNDSVHSLQPALLPSRTSEKVQHHSFAVNTFPVPEVIGSLHTHMSKKNLYQSKSYIINPLTLIPKPKIPPNISKYKKLPKQIHKLKTLPIKSIYQKPDTEISLKD